MKTASTKGTSSGRVYASANAMATAAMTTTDTVTRLARSSARMPLGFCTL